MKDPTNPKSGKTFKANSRKILDYFWEIFIAEHPGLVDCLDALLGKTGTEGQPRCKSCGSCEIERGAEKRTGKCKCCNKTVWLTAGSFFENIRSPRAWLAAIWLTERGISFSALQLSELTGVAPSTAWEIMKKVNTVILDEMRPDSQAIQICSARFAPIFCKRSVLTPAGEHPTAEQEEMEKSFQDPEAASHSHSHNHNQRARTAASSNPTSSTNQADPSANPAPRQFSAQEQELLDILSDKPIDYQALSRQTTMTIKELSSTLIILELEEFIQSLPGDRFILRTPPSQAVLQKNQASSASAEPVNDPTENVEAVITYVKGVFQGISRKYLQLYLASHWCFVDRGYWKPGSLIEACRRFRYVDSEDIRAFVSPLMVTLRAC